MKDGLFIEECSPKDLFKKMEDYKLGLKEINDKLVEGLIKGGDEVKKFFKQRDAAIEKLQDKLGIKRVKKQKCL